MIRLDDAQYEGYSSIADYDRRNDLAADFDHSPRFMARQQPRKAVVKFEHIVVLD